MAGVSKGAPKRSDHFPSQAAEPLKGLVRLLARQAARQELSGKGADNNVDWDDAQDKGLTDDALAAAPEASNPTSRNPS